MASRPAIRLVANFAVLCDVAGDFGMGVEAPISTAAAKGTASSDRA